ncbi:HAD family hydrolase [Roseburia sp. 499]|uniref:HAD family hydrolase n=1 Tax=Roseburia sp. 499 TaxID=1261634 RepID=UPI0009526CF1|nr:HAD family phosphatase [Roseburia sp. 499]WVK68928.1 HAD family phosphatase [Roseburia sp. 499]
MKAVVFDMDGVVIDSEWLVADCWKQIAEKYGIHDVEILCKKCLGLNKEAAKEIFLKYYGNDFPYERYKKEMADLFHEREAEELMLKPGVKELLQWLKEQNYRIGLATSTRESVAKKSLGNLDVLSYFDEVVCGDMLEKSKPEPDIYLMACEQLQVLPEESYAIEDSYNGIRAAYSAGMSAIMVPDIMEPDEEMKEKSIIILPNLIEVKKWMEKNV